MFMSRPEGLHYVTNCGRLAQLGERRVRNAEVGSSSLLPSTNSKIHARVVHRSAKRGGGPSLHGSFAPVIVMLQPVLTRNRVRLAYAIAVTTDTLQLLLGPMGWAFADEVLDMMAMVLTWRVLGFHPLLLPTFALEFLPVTDLLPTWTGCVALVVALRKRQGPTAPEPPHQGPVIDV